MKNLFAILILLLILFSWAYAQRPTEQDSIPEVLPADTLLVGVKISPPFVIQNSEGELTGVSVRLWENIAEELNVVSVYKTYTLSKLLQALEKGEIDVCINPLTVTSERLTRFSFSQPFYTANLAIAVPGAKQSFFMVLITNVFTNDFLNAVLILIGVIAVFGLLLWLVEKKHNEQFSKGIRGFGQGMWWAAVTMTTVGYGDKAPKTIAGRLLSVLWMFVAITIISSLTASITTTLTMDRIGSSIDDLRDLRKIKVGTVEASSSYHFLKREDISPMLFDTYIDGLEALSAKKINAFVYDEPILRYTIHEEGLADKMQIVPQTFGNQYYSFSMPHHHPLLNRINPVLLRELESLRWKGILQEYRLE